MSLNHPDGPAITLDRAHFYRLIDEARLDRSMNWSQVTRETGVGIDVFRRLREGQEPRLSAYLSLATWLNRGDIRCPLPGATGTLYTPPTGERPA